MGYSRVTCWAIESSQYPPMLSHSCSYSDAGVRFIWGKGELVYGISIVVLFDLCDLALVS